MFAGLADRAGQVRLAGGAERLARGDERDGVRGAVEHRADQLGHAGIGHQVAARGLRPRLGADDAGEEPAGIGHQRAARLQDQPGGIREGGAHRVGQAPGVRAGESPTQAESRSGGSPAAVA